MESLPCAVVPNCLSCCESHINPFFRRAQDTHLHLHDQVRNKLTWLLSIIANVFHRLIPNNEVLQIRIPAYQLAPRRSIECERGQKENPRTGWYQGPGYCEGYWGADRMAESVGTCVNEILLPIMDTVLGPIVIIVRFWYMILKRTLWIIYDQDIFISSWIQFSSVQFSTPWTWTSRTRWWYPTTLLKLSKKKKKKRSTITQTEKQKPNKNMRPYHGHDITEATLSKRLEVKDEDSRPLPKKRG